MATSILGGQTSKCLARLVVEGYPVRAPSKIYLNKNTVSTI